MKKRSQQGIALVITLILLSVTLVMAVAFLALSHRERGSVTTSTETATSKLAADSALANAEAEIIANVLSSTNPYSFGMLVSTNCPPLTFSNLSDYTSLFYSPRVPVFMSNTITRAMENRFYLDLNRNGVDDPSGLFNDVNNSGATNGLVSLEVGDPEWVGVLERPDVPYGPVNIALSRYAFIAIPVGNALDLNAIHNQVFDEANANQTVNPSENTLNGQDFFFRNQGVGSWEINLAAFLADLNTNEWTSYNYNQTNRTPNSGISFDDARALLAYRYNNNYGTLANLVGTPAANVFPFDNIDGYSDGPLQTTTVGINESIVANQDVSADSWAGSDNTNHYFDLTADLFDTTKTEMNIPPPGFTDRLLATGTNTYGGSTVSTYDRYTFYRLLSQLGTDSEPESGKINLNYDNLTPNANGVASETNFFAWSPVTFFTNAADRMLRLYTTNWLASDTNDFVATFNVTNAFGITDIPVLVSNQFVYTPSVQRVLQLAANIYDASVTNFYPSRFRPVFLVTNENGFNDVYVSGYVQQTNAIIQASEFQAASNPDLATPVDAAALPSGTNILANVYGVPWIIGAKKGFPNFNEFSMENAFQITRKLEVVRVTTPWQSPWQLLTNQMYFMNISNYFGAECWNSYRSGYYGAGTANPGAVDIMVRDNMSMELTNQGGLTYFNNATNWTVLSQTIWPGFQLTYTNSFLIPLNTNAALFTNDLFVFGSPNYFIGAPPTFQNYQNAGTPPLPQFGLLTTNRLQVVIIDYSAGPNAGQVVDYVQLNGMDSSRDPNAEIADVNATHDGLWDTNLYGGSGGIPQGVINQIQTSSRGGTIPAIDLTDGGSWAAVPGLPAISPASQHAYEQYYLSLFLSPHNTGTFTDQNPPYKTYQVAITTNAVQVAYTPTRNRIRRFTWQANDPLVHYLTSDLVDTLNDANPQHVVDWPWNLVGELNERYMPWGGNPAEIPNSSAADANTLNAFNMELKDPQAVPTGVSATSDYWDFPTNKYPTVGWLGRVHRGTPWQTVYLKSRDLLTNSSANYDVNDWQAWTGNGNQFDATNTAPVQDRFLFDLFTTAFNDNATRGQLSINVGAPNGPSLAAWSAVFSGIAVPPPSVTNNYSVISPAGAYDPANPPPLVQIVQGINSTRAALVNADGVTNTFEHVGSILRVPQLTEQSPFLNPANTNYNNDEMYEWLPQQTLSLLRVSSAPRYVIYSYGQTLKPAPGSTVTSGGQFFGMVTNYQVVSETSTRAVVRVEDANTPHPHIVLESFNILPPN